MKIISVFGVSGAGKGTVATMLCMLDDRLHRAKFARPMKRELEESFSLPEGFLEHRCMKSVPTSHRGYETFLDRMVKLYHARQHLTELPGETKELLSQCYNYGLVPVFDDCRNAREAGVLVENDTYGVFVDSNRGESLSSDGLQWNIYQNLTNRLGIYNYGSLPDLMYDVEKLYHKSIKPWLDS